MARFTIIRMEETAEFIKQLPKAELHLHLVGSASADIVLGLARRHPDGDVPTEAAELARFYEFTDFPHFINNYAKVDDLVRTSADVRDLVLGLARDAARSNVRYAEVTVTAAMHLAKGIGKAELGDALSSARDDALREHKVELAYIYDIPAGFGFTDETVDFAVNVRPQGTVALGLAGLEVGYPRADFAPSFDIAREAGLHLVAHAGETTGADQVWSAIRGLGVERIGHGIGAAEDPELLEYLATNGIALEVCPTSNVCTRATPVLEEHPLPVLLAAGAPVTINTDDPGMFHTDLNREYAVAAALGKLDNAGLADLARNSVRYSFCPPETRERLLAEISSIA